VRYVQALGQKLTAHAPGDKWPYNFHVVNQKEVNAFALPGGPIYVNLGTIQAADNEAQLAGVMAHEISHVVQRHATRAATKQMYAQVPLAVLGSLLGRGVGGQLAQLGIQFGVGSYFLKNSRQAESEADLIGTDIMYDTGYNPQAMADFFKKLEAEGGARGPQFLSDHPNPGNRAVAVAKEVKTLPGKKFQQDSSEFQSIKRQVAGMKPLSAQEIAAQQKPAPGTSTVTPNKNLKPFEHSAYTVSYPDNWKVFGDQNSTVTIAPQEGVGENAIAYGVIIDGFQPEQGRSLDQATHDLLQQLQQGNPDLKAVGNDENITVNGVKGKSVNLVGPSPIKDQNGQAARERDWLVVVPRKDGTILYLVFISPDRDFNSMQPAFQSMLRTLRLK
jgi:beta-barrel assembly-enhancing protease